MSSEYRKKVLLSGEKKVNLNFIYQALKSYYHIDLIDNSLLNKEHILEVNPDILLIDCSEININTYELYKELKSTLPILFLTGLRYGKRRLKDAVLCNFDYILNCFDFDYLITKIENLFSCFSKKKYCASDINGNLQVQKVFEFIGSLAEYRNVENRGHIYRIKQYLKILADYLKETEKYKSNLNDEIIEIMVNASALHDIGKINVPENILLKPSSLTDKEFMQVKEHISKSSIIINEFEAEMGNSFFFKIAKDMALFHHEKWDGSGYLFGLKKRYIPLSARMLILCDIYDALVSNRVYHQLTSHSQAVDIIWSGRREFFEPEIVDAFLEVSDNFKIVIENY